MLEPQPNHCCDFIVQPIVISSKMFHHFQKWDENLMVPTWVCMVGGPRWWNPSIKSQQFFSHLCVVKHCHIEGEAAACEDELFAIVSQYRSELTAFPSVGCHIGSERPVQAFFKTHTSLSNGSDVYTFLSINRFHSLMNVDQRHVFWSEELLSVHAVSSFLIYSCYTLLCLQAQFRAI